MKGVFGIKKPREVEFSMTITMKLEEWERLNNQLKSDFPSWRLSELISKLIDRARVVFREEIEDQTNMEE